MVNVNYTMFEATHVHPSCIGHDSRHDLVIVPTESSRQAWLASGLDPGKMRVSPLGIDPAGSATRSPLGQSRPLMAVERALTGSGL